ncbi:MAG: ABC transporter ATP-binding protein, partial [Proteobacteria bacterium]
MKTESAATEAGAVKEPKRYLEDEVRFTGNYSKNVTRTILETFRPYLKMTWTSLLIGIIARLCLLSTANISGYWADSLCQNESFCHALPSFFDGYQTMDFLYLLMTVVSVGFICNLIFRVSISRTGAKAVSTLYDEVTMHVSRFPMDFFDKTPVGRIMSRFSSDYASIFRMAGGPLGEFLGLAFDLIAT